MRIGLVTDAHNHAGALARALAILRERGADAVVSLGDNCDAFSSGGEPGEVVRLLREAGAVGTWGNHDFSLSRHVSERARRRHGEEDLAYLATMRPRLVLADCHFSHREPSIDLEDPAALWSIEEGPPVLATIALAGLAATPERFLFVGHYHRWAAVTPRDLLPWSGEAPLRLADHPRCFVFVGPVCEGHCGLFDSDTGELFPLACGGP
jgi:predicted phosphodiesterase